MFERVHEESPEVLQRAEQYGPAWKAFIDEEYRVWLIRHPDYRREAIARRFKNIIWNPSWVWDYIEEANNAWMAHFKPAYEKWWGEKGFGVTWNGIHPTLYEVSVRH